MTVRRESRTIVPVRPIRRAALTALNTEYFSSTYELSILLCDDDAIRELNHRYRNEDSATDVLAFPQTTELPKPKKYPVPNTSLNIKKHDERPLILGDVVVSVETATRQAKQYKHTLETEVARLVIHGTLHLVGWNDGTPTTRAKMMRRERALMREWRLTDLR